MVTFDPCTVSGHSWAIAIAAFFLIRGYFIIHQAVFFTPKLKNAVTKSITKISFLLT